MARKPAPKRILPGHVLIVEDEAVLGLLLEDALHRAGVATVDICSTTDCALAALRRKQPDAIVLDVHLADRDDGWAIAELVKALGPDSPRIVFATGQPGDIPPEIAEMGCVLEKPYEPEILIKLLSRPRKHGVVSRLRGALRSG